MRLQNRYMLLGLRQRSSHILNHCCSQRAVACLHTLAHILVLTYSIISYCLDVQALHQILLVRSWKALELLYNCNNTAHAYHKLAAYATTAAAVAPAVMAQQLSCNRFSSKASATLRIQRTLRMHCSRALSCCKQQQQQQQHTVEAARMTCTVQ
jgi:hypothetical protein